MRVVAFDAEVLEAEFVERFVGDDKAGKGMRFAGELVAETGDVVVFFHAVAGTGGVDVGVDDGVSEVTNL